MMQKEYVGELASIWIYERKAAQKELNERHYDDKSEIYKTSGALQLDDFEIGDIEYEYVVHYGQPDDILPYYASNEFPYMGHYNNAQSGNVAPLNQSNRGGPDQYYITVTGHDFRDGAPYWKGHTFSLDEFAVLPDIAKALQN